MDATEGKNESIIFQFPRNEALVFFEWLYRFNKSDREKYLEHDAEEQILFDLEASLERILVEPFKENYEDLVDKARKEVFPPDLST